MKLQKMRGGKLPKEGRQTHRVQHLGRGQDKEIMARFAVMRRKPTAPVDFG
jgi:hypothetical protein